jgi:hypothetical protein
MAAVTSNVAANTTTINHATGRLCSQLIMSFPPEVLPREHAHDGDPIVLRVGPGG